MIILLIVLIVLFLLRLLIAPKSSETAVLPSQYSRVMLETVDGLDCLVWDGVRYYAYQGIETDGVAVWDWHGRMGDGLGVLVRCEGGFPVGELYRLREGGDEFLLASLPEDGWPITDMQIFVREGAELPQISAEGFAFGEIYLVSGEFPEEELEKVCDLIEPSEVRALAEAWLHGAPVSVPDGEYETYRVRLHWGAVPGLYVTFLLNVSQKGGEGFLEKIHFQGDVLVSELFLKELKIDLSDK